MTKVLILDDEKDIADLLATFLKNEGFEVITAYTGKEALANLSPELDLALLDVMLPDADGFDILKKIRQDYLFPVLMLTAKDEQLDKITGLTLGADDYITKPFNPLEVVARVKTQLRRYQTYNTGALASDNQGIFDYQGLSVYLGSHKVFLYGTEIHLTPLEFKILWYLCEHQGQVVSSEALFEAVWEEKYLDNNNTVMAHIARLRDKLNEPPRKPKFIKTVWGVGYTIEA